MRFFVDNNIAPAIARALHALADYDDHEVYHLKDKFDRATNDEVWLTTLAQEGGWVILSGDHRITKRPHERQAWLESGLTAFFLAKRWMTTGFHQQAWMLVRWWPEIFAQAARVESGTGFLIPFAAKGRFKVIQTL